MWHGTICEEKAGKSEDHQSRRANSPTDSKVFNEADLHHLANHGSVEPTRRCGQLSLKCQPGATERRDWRVTGEDRARGCVVPSLRAPSNNGLGGRWSVLEEKPL